MLKVKIKTNMDILQALVIILGHVNALEIKPKNIKQLIIEHEVRQLAVKIYCNNGLKSIVLPPAVVIALYDSFESVMKYLQPFEQLVYRNIIIEMDAIYTNNVKIENFLLLK